MALPACEESDLRRRAEWAHEWLERFYVENPLGHNWKVVKLEIGQQLDIEVDIEVPDPGEVRKLRGRSGMERLAILRLVCPAPDAKVWKILTDDQNVWIDLTDLSGDKLIGGTCRRI